MKNSVLVRMIFACFLAVSAAYAQPTTKTLTALPNFGPHGDGSLRVGDASYITINSFQRGLAYNPATGNLIFIDREADGSGTAAITGKIYVLDSLTGNVITTLNTNGMAGGNYADTPVAVADDGAIYVANLVNNAASNAFTIYRWDSDSSVNPPTIVYAGNPSPGITPRWGETLDARGSGANTLLLAGSKTQTTPGTNVAIFTATDAAATNFVAHLIATDIAASETGTSSDPGMGVAFGAGNTFWTKHKGGAPLRHLSFDLTNNTSTSIHVFGTNVFPSSANLGPIAVDAANNLMALADLSTPNTVRLYDISNLTKPPVLLDIETFPTSNGNASAGAVYLDFGGGKLYAHSINNGILGLSVDTASMDVPQFVTQPSGTIRTTEGRSVFFEALAIQATSYQWQKNGTNIVGATSPTLTLASVLSTDTGIYSANAINAAGTTLATSSATLNVISTSNLFRLTPMWVSSVGGAVNSLNVAATNYINQGGGSSTPNQRTIAYNPLSNQLYVISRTNSSSVNFGIFVINATNGQYLYNLKTNNISGGSIGLVSIACADDGAIYACNVDTTSTASGTTANWKLYRWANSDSNTVPTMVFSGEPTGQSGTPFRWGDAMSVRGSGASTQIIIDNNNAGTRYSAMLVPTDGTMTTFTSSYQNLANTIGTTIGRSVQWGTNNGDGTYTFWQKRKGTNLVQSTFDPASPGGIANVQTSIVFPTTLGAVALDASRNFVVGIDYNGNASTPNSVALYDISDSAAPLFINRYSFTVNQFGNANFIGQVILTSNYVFAIDGNNGLMAFTVGSGPATPPTILGQPASVRLVTGQSASLSVSSPDANGYQWRRNGSNISGATSSIYTINNAALTDAGSYLVVLTNNTGATTSSVATVTIVSSNDVYRLSQKWQYLPGTNAAGSFANYVTYNGGSGTPNERTIAYNAQLNELYIVQRNASDYAIHVIDGSTGNELRTLSTNGLVLTGTGAGGGNFVGLVAIGVAADGAIYASTLAPDACGCAAPTGLFRLYRWANSSSTTDPVQIFQGDPAGQATSLRWGDVMDIRGSGLSTEIVMNNNQGTFGAILRPTDGTLTNFASTYFTESTVGTPIGRSLQFSGQGTNVIWQKRSTLDVQLWTYDLGANTGAMNTNYSIFPATFGPVAIDESRNFVVGINFSSVSTAPDTLEMYSTADPLTPLLLLSRHNFPINHQANQNFIGQVIISGDKVFALSANNGLLALDILSPTVPKLSVSASGGNLTLGWTNSATGFVLQSTTSLSPVNWTNANATLTTNSGTVNATIPISGTTKFYRLQK